MFSRYCVKAGQATTCLFLIKRAVKSTSTSKAKSPPTAETASTSKVTKQITPSKELKVASTLNSTATATTASTSKVTKQITPSKELKVASTLNATATATTASVTNTKPILPTRETKIIAPEVEKPISPMIIEPVKKISLADTLADYFFKRFLFLTNTITSGIFMALGDLIVQEHEYQSHQSSIWSKMFKPQTSIRYDWERVKRMAIVGTVFGSLHHFYYIYLDILLPRRSVINVIIKVAADQFFCAPLTILCFFLVLGFLESKTLRESIEELYEKFIVVYMVTKMFSRYCVKAGQATTCLFLIKRAVKSTSTSKAKSPPTAETASTSKVTKQITPSKELKVASTLNSTATATTASTSKVTKQITPSKELKVASTLNATATATTASVTNTKPILPTRETKIIAPEVEKPISPMIIEPVKKISLADTLADYFFKRFLFLTNTITSGIFMALGDLIVQEHEYQSHQSSIWSKMFKPQTSIRYDWERVKRMAIVGTVFGSLHHFYYIYLDILLPRRSVINVIIKVAADQFFCAPLTILCFFLVLGFLESKTLRESIEELYEKFIVVYMGDCMFWPPVQAINFYFVPTEYRVFYINAATMIFDIFLSYAKHDI